METENNSIYTIDPMTRSRIFMQYAGQRMQMRNTHKTIYTFYCVDLKVCSVFEETGNGFPVGSASILLKPLGEISDEDAIELQKIVDWGYEDGYFPREAKIKRGREYSKDEKLQLPVQAFDFLRSRGYALPYGKWSVEQLVELGIYKLTQ